MRALQAPRSMVTAADGQRVLAEVSRAGAAVESVVFTRNRRVMISVGRGGRDLRIHEGFREAPAEVLRAVGVLLSGRRRGQGEARRRVQDFIHQIPALQGAPAPRRRRRVYADDLPHLERLQQEFDRVNAEHFDGALPRVPLYLSGRMRRRNGHFSVRPLEIVVSRRLCEEAAEGEAAATLRHEMIHLWQHQQGTRPGHGPDFRRWARELDVHPRAAREVVWSWELKNSEQ